MGEITSGTPYDDVFRTLLNDCTSLIIPVVNEVFEENYTGNEPIHFLPNEHFINWQDANTKEKITDSCFQIYGKSCKKYHIECQSNSDSSMSIRMFEYDSQIALDNGELIENRLIVTFPHSAVLFLRHTKNTPDTMTVQIKTPGGNISYNIPVMKTQQYSIDEIFDKNLLFLIPFYIFTYEKNLKEYEHNSQKLQELQKEYSDILKRLEALCLSGKISEYEKCTIIDMSKRVIEHITAHYANVRKGVTSIMGGKVLEYEAKTILQRGIREGKIEGRIEGKLELTVSLINDGLLSISEGAKRLNMKEEELKKYL